MSAQNLTGDAPIDNAMSAPQASHEASTETLVSILSERPIGWDQSLTRDAQPVLLAALGDVPQQRSPLENIPPTRLNDLHCRLSCHNLSPT
jgi:hypothetical protein